MNVILDIPMSKIRPGPNDRKTFDRPSLQTLADSIEQHGLAQPITVRPVNNGYEIVAGERRYRAMALLNREAIAAIVRDLSDEEASAIMLVENASRVDLDPITEAEAYQSRLDRFGWTIAHTAKMAGVSDNRVRDRLKLLRLAHDVRHYIKHNQFPASYALLLTKLDTNRQRIALRAYNATSALSLVKFRELVNKLYNDQVNEQHQNLLTLEMQIVEEAQSPTHLSGKKAQTGAPTNRKLPPVRVQMSDNVGAILDRYIADLLFQGQKNAAEALGNIYNTLVAFNWASVPAMPHLDATGIPGEAHQNAHYQKL